MWFFIPVIAAGAGPYVVHTVIQQFRSKANLVPGCILKTDLDIFIEHSGIYLGDGQVAEFNHSGYVSQVSLKEFCGGAFTGITIYTAIDKKGETLHDPLWLKRARDQLGRHHKYWLTDTNCHNFVISCIQDSFDNNKCWTFSDLKIILKSHGYDDWQPCWRKFRDD